MFIAIKKLNKCKKSLEAWSRDNFGNVQKNIKQIKDCLWRAEAASVKIGDYEEVARLKKDLNDLLDKEEKMWQQCSYIHWLKSVDQNTRFFHGLVTQKKRKNFIKGLRDGQGVW